MIGLTAQAKTYDGTTSATLTGTPVLLGGVGSDAVSLTGAAVGTFADASVGMNKLVNISGLSITGADAGNYTLTPPTTTADIRPPNPPCISSLGYDSGSGTFRGTFQGYPNFGYRIETATSMAGPWLFLQSVTADTNGQFEVVDTQSPQAQARYYRTLYP